MCFYFDVSLDVSFVLVFPAIFGILVFGVFIGLLLVPIGVLFQDVAQIVAILLTAMMFLCPVICIISLKLNPLFNKLVAILLLKE